MKWRVFLIHALMCWAFEVGPGHPANLPEPQRRFQRCSWGADWEGPTEKRLPQGRAGDRGFIFSLHHREKQAQGPEDNEVQLFLLLFQFFQLRIVLILQRWPEEAREAQG